LAVAGPEFTKIYASRRRAPAAIYAVDFRQKVPTGERSIPADGDRGLTPNFAAAPTWAEVTGVAMAA
jgi:hypothetical protein